MIKSPATIDRRTLARARRQVPIVIGTLGVLIPLGDALWYWWSNDPVGGHYKTLTNDRGTITSLVTATGAVNLVISV